jgi:hypothetical protein
MGIRFVEINGEQFVEHDGPLESWWLDTPFGCGWVATKDGRIIAGAPIFFRMTGWDLGRCPNHYRYEKLCEETEEMIRLYATDKNLSVKERLIVLENQTKAREEAIKYGVLQ